MVQQIALVSGVEIVELIALGFQNDNPIALALALDGKKEVRIDFGAFPALQAILTARNIAVPPFQGLFVIQIASNGLFVLVQVVFIDWRKQALGQRIAFGICQLASIFWFAGFDGEGQAPVLAVKTQAELNGASGNTVLEYLFRVVVSDSVQRTAQTRTLGAIPMSL